MSEEKKEGYYHIVKDFFDSLGLDDSAGEPSNKNPYMRPPSDVVDCEPATLPRYRSEETCKLIVRDLKEYCRLYINLHQPHYQGARRKLRHSNDLPGDNAPEMMKRQIPPMPFTVAIRRKATRVSITTTRSRKSVHKSHKRMTPSNKTSNTTYYSQSSTDVSYHTADNRRSSPSTCISSLTNFTCFCCYHEAPLKVQCTERAVGHHVDTASKEIQVDLDENQAGCSKDSDNRLTKRLPTAFSPKKRPRVLSNRLVQRRIRNVRRNPVRILPSRNDAGTNTEDPDGLSWVFQDVQEMVTFCSGDLHQLQEICPSVTPPSEFESEIELEDDVESVISSYSSDSVSESSGLSTFSITPMTGTEMFIDEAKTSQSVPITATNSTEFTIIHQSTRSQDDKSTVDLSSSLDEFATIVDDPSSPKCSTIVSTMQSDATTYFTCSEDSDATLVPCDESEDSMDICSQIDDLERSLLARVATITHPEQMIQEPCRRSSSTSASDLKRSFSSKFNIYFVNKESKF